MKNKLLVAAFLEGFFLLAFELFAAQLLHPIYGNSYFVWLSILSVTMLASACGYFLGGFMSKKDDSKIKIYVFSSLIIISIFAFSLYRLNSSLFKVLNSSELILGSILQTSGLLFIPLLFLTSLNPIIVKYFTEESAGKSSSKVFFTSTIGGIVSIYLIAFGILPSLDLILIIKIFPVAILISVVMFYVSSSQIKFLFTHLAVSFLLFFGITINQKENLQGKNTKVIYRTHGIMGEIEIREEFGKARFLSINRTTQSAIKKENGASLWSYPYRVATYASLAPLGSDVLVAGLGGGILVNNLIGFQFNIDCIEFDRRTIGVAKKYMGLKPNVNLKIDDFRHYINASEKKYDVILLDLSKGESLPVNVYTVEAFKKMYSMLKPDGFIILHYFSDVYNTGEFGLKSIIKTMNAAGGFASLIKKQEADQNPEELIIASNKPEIISNFNYKVSPNLLSTYGFITENIFDKSFNTDDGVILYDGNNKLEKVQLNVVKEIRKNLRDNEYQGFYK